MATSDGILGVVHSFRSDLYIVIPSRSLENKQDVVIDSRGIVLCLRLVEESTIKAVRIEVFMIFRNDISCFGIAIPVGAAIIIEILSLYNNNKQIAAYCKCNNCLS